MESKVVRAFLSNSEGASDSVLTAGVVQVTGWFPVNQNNVISAIKKVSVAEVRQYVTVAAAANIVAFSKYQVAIGNTANRREGAQNQLTYFGYTAPAVLTGVAATDKYNAYFSIAYKINHTSSARANAGSEVSIAVGTITGTYAQYEVVIGGTSGAMGYFISGATSPLIIAVFYGQFVSGEVITGQTSGATSTSSAGPTLGLGLAIIDIGNYMSAYTKGFFQGPNTVLVTAGFAATDLTITTAGVISQGIGSRLVDDVPQLELLSPNLRQGLFSFPTMQNVIATATYTFYAVRDNIPVLDNASAGTDVGAFRTQVFYANEQATNYAAFVTAMATNFPSLVTV